MMGPGHIIISLVVMPSRQNPIISSTSVKLDLDFDSITIPPYG